MLKKSPSFVPRAHVQQYARSEARVPRRAPAPPWLALEQWWGCAECCGQEQLLCDCGSVTSTVEAPTGAMLLLCARQVCCAAVVLQWAVVLVYARDTYTLSSGPKRAAGTGKKKVSVIPSLLHERHLWRAMYCKPMVISNKGVATVAVDACVAEVDSA